PGLDIMRPPLQPHLQATRCLRQPVTLNISVAERLQDQESVGMALLDELQESSFTAAELAALDADQVAFKADLLRRPAQPQTFLQMVLCLIISPRLPCRARRQEMHLPAAWPHPQTNSQMVSNRDQVMLFHRLECGLVMTPSSDVPACNGDSRTDERQQSKAKQRQR